MRRRWWKSISLGALAAVLLDVKFQCETRVFESAVSLFRLFLQLLIVAV
jgi:hypothetical protein